MKEKFLNKNILISGANGFTGTWLSTYLNMLGGKVYGFGLKTCHTNEFYTAQNSRIFTEHKILDIRDNQNLVDTYSKLNFDYIFHLAAQPLVLEAYDDPSTTMHANVTGTINLIDFIIKFQPTSKNIFVTTDKVYFNSNKGKPFGETDTLWGNEPYASSKVAMEAVIEGFFQAYPSLKNRSVTVRAGNIFGGGDFSHNRLIVDYFRAKYGSKNLTIRKPQSIRPWQHVIEVIDAYCKLISNDACLGSAYNVGPNISNCISVLDLVTIFNGYDRNQVDIQIKEETKEYESGMLSLDNTKIINEGIWHPKIDLDTAVRLTSHWYENYKKVDALTIIEDQLSEVLSV